jgi:hypothetical protein
MIKAITGILLMSAFWFSCQDIKEKDKEINHFIYKEIKIKTSFKLEIGACLNWYTSFENIKKTVVYKDRIISVGLYGGLCCLKAQSFEVDKVMTKKLNSDLFTDISVIGDTLFSELFDKVYYLDNNLIWKTYEKVKPIKYFSTLLDDKDYIFYFSDSGEWSGVLFVYNKKSGINRALIISCPRSVVQLNKVYHVSACMEHLGLWGDYVKISDIEKLRAVSDTLSLRDRCWQMFRYQINDTTKKANEFIHHGGITQNNWDTVIISSFAMGERMFHFIHMDRKLYIGRIINNKFIFLDTIPYIDPENIISYGDRLKVVNERCWSKGFCLIRNDTVYKITFENSYFPKDNQVSSSKSYTSIFNGGNIWTIKPGQAACEIEFDFNKTYKIIGLYGNNQDGNYIVVDGKKKS